MSFRGINTTVIQIRRQVFTEVARMTISAPTTPPRRFLRACAGVRDVLPGSRLHATAGMSTCAT